MRDWPENVALGGRRWQAPYAEDPVCSRGRFHNEPDSPLRSPFQRDRDRILHSDAFRRLKHKTQVFVVHEVDHFRTRLSHTLEVAQVARSIARPLGLDEDLAEAVSLAHDLGHTPFGHAGERALDRALAPNGGFDHNAQSFRVVTLLEDRYPDFPGLNLSWETLEGLVKHNGPIVDAGGSPAGPYAGKALPHALATFPAIAGFELHLFPSLEAQVAALSDDIAYASHDVEDGLRAGLITLAELADIPLTGGILREIGRDHPLLDSQRRIRELARRLITQMIEDAILTSAVRIGERAPACADEVRRAPHALVSFSDATAAQVGELKSFLFARLYRHPDVMRPVVQAEQVVADLFAALAADPLELPADWRPEPGTGRDTPRHVADYIAGMTDRFALMEHRRLFDATPDLG
ncbi:deoxyguanosinetriphosphate triphosphohydrolase [Faunimonas sp. B44]|uniref:deoxyguanosinetriphosphate triphosphohydrolase n=1 Tax=Faunimonas sp. B44 TaxID=3461493 RepID=UPI004044C515